jgi:multiple antibiotic resistance protein
MSLFSIALVLFLIMDPVGNLSYYLTLMKDVDPRRQKWVLLREMLFALVVMLGFNYLGEFIFSVLELSETTVRLSSGLILFLVAIKILFPATNSLRANLPKGEPFIIPLAIPLITGPALMATIMLYAHLEPYQSVMLLAILFAWLVALAILFFAKPIRKVLGQNGLMACERLMGMVLVLIAVQRFLEGILLFWATQPHPL